MTKPVEEMTNEVVARFESRIHPEPNTGCWLWAGTIGAGGYGTMFYAGKHHRAHRVAFAIANGSVPPILDHLCRNRLCVNPEQDRKSVV